MVEQTPAAEPALHDNASGQPEQTPEPNGHIERLLDEALAATFPASDPVSTLDV